VLVENLSFKSGDVSLHAVAAGPRDGQVVILLHGFPEFWYGWHRQIEPLAAAGFRVIVPDQRGYRARTAGRDDLSIAAEFVRHVSHAPPTAGEERLLRSAFEAVRADDEGAAR